MRSVALDSLSLPAPSTPLIGRTRDLDHIRATYARSIGAPQPYCGIADEQVDPDRARLNRELAGVVRMILNDVGLDEAGISSFDPDDILIDRVGTIDPGGVLALHVPERESSFAVPSPYIRIGQPSEHDGQVDTGRGSELDCIQAPL
jgi:hypothetical protein